MSKKIDYLTADPEIPGQKWVCMSFLTPELVKNCDVRSVKVRGCYSTEEEAKNRCEELQRFDGLHNVYVAPVGKWLPWCDDPEKASDFEYAETELNKLMKAYKKNQEKAKMLHEERKNNLINNSNNDKEVNTDNLINNEDIQSDKEELQKLKSDMVSEKDNLEGITDELEKAELLYKQMLENEKQNI